MTNIPSANAIAEVAALIGDAARANMLAALMGGQALAAGELAHHAGVSAQTTSGHLARLLDARLIAVQKQGRHRYYRLASPQIAHALEALMAVAASGPKRHRPPGPRDEALRLARTCYDHMAGRLGIAVADALVARDHVVLSEGAGIITESGRAFLCTFGIALDAKPSTRPLCRTCLDWSERRPHLAGRLGAALLASAEQRAWVRRAPSSRALVVTPAGHHGFTESFGLPRDWAG